uniref:Uncharacterized protein n=1 Tax=Quercus lobata TaxID=97700 RepID=A0A7N2M2Q9_QUELO
MFKDGCWNWEKLSFVVPSTIKEKINEIPIPLFGESKDFISWKYTLNGEFSTTSAYKLAKPDECQIPEFLGGWIWKLDTAPKMRHFLWLCHHRSVSVRETIAAKGVECDMICLVCKNAEEPLSHALRECPFTLESWRNIKTPMTLQASFQLELLDWLKSNCLCDPNIMVNGCPWRIQFPFVVCSMARSVSTTTILNIFKVFVYFQVALFITLIRGYVISTSSFRLTLFVTVLVLTFLSPAHAEKYLSLFEFFVTILTSTSSFVISESPVIVILILTDSSLISNIKPWLERFLVNPSSLGTSNNIGLESNGSQALILPELPPEVIRENVNRLYTFRDFIAAAGVSRTWRYVCLSISRRPQLLVNRSSSSTSLVTSNNIGLESNGPQAPIWSELPADMIGEIGNQIPNSKDIKAILTFCNPCSSACFETTTWSLFPWLMLSNKLDSDLQCFFNLWLELPTSDQKRCWGSPHGLVVTLGPYEAYLVHVRKEEQIALPPLNPIRALAQLEEVAFNRGGDEAALNRRGQGQWAIVTVTNPDNLKFNDVACFEDKIYALCGYGQLLRLELDAPLAAKAEVINRQPRKEEIGTPQKLYLMKSQKNLIAVFRYTFHNPKKMRQETERFLVCNFNFSESKWKVTDLKDCTAFVGDGNSWCIPTSTIPSRNNCIYFTDDNWELQMYPGVAYGGRDVGVFNIAQKVTQQLPFGKDNPRFYSRPIWVTPSYYVFR